MDTLCFTAPFSARLSPLRNFEKPAQCARHKIHFTRPVVMTCAPLQPQQHSDNLPATPLPLTNPAQLANLELIAGNPAAAVSLLEAHLANNASDAQAWLQLAKAFRVTSGLPRAVSVLRRAVAAVPGDPCLWHFYADLTNRMAGPYRARQVLRLAIQNCKENSVLYCACAVSEAELSNHRAASLLFESAVKLDPTDPISYLKWANAEQSNRKFDRARLVYQKGISKVHKQSLPVLYTSYAGMEANGRRFEASRHLYRLAAECNPKDKMVWQAWACMEERSGNLDRARQLFERGILADPTYICSWQAWGLLEQRAGNLDSARALFERGTHADSIDPVCWQAWACLEAENGNVVEARRLFAEGAQRVPSNERAAPLYLQWGRSEEQNGDPDFARELFQTALDRTHEKHSDKAIILHSWAGLERRAGNIKKSRELFSRVLELNRRDFRALYAWGMLELAERDYGTAHKLLTRCLKIAPRDFGAVQALATLEFEQFSSSGGCKRARALLRRVTNRHRRNDRMLQFWASLEEKHGDAHLAEQIRESLE